MDPVTVVIEILFVVLFVATLVRYLRRRDALSRDVMLIFGCLAGLFVVAGIGVVAGDLPDPVVGGALALLLAQPLFTLRLADRLSPIPRWLRLGSLAAYIGLALPFVVLPLRTLPVLVFAGIAFFVLTNGAAAFYLYRAARGRVGAARIRLGSAAAASALMAIALAQAIVLTPVIGDASSVVSRVVGLAAAVMYAIAFLPPAWLVRVLNAVALFGFTEQLMEGARGEQAVAVWTRMAELARRTTGALGAVIVIGDPPATAALTADDISAWEAALAATPLPAVPAAQDDHRPAPGDDLLRLARAVGGAYVSVLRFDLAGGEPAALLIVRERPSLFAADDHAMLAALSDRARVFAERSQAMNDEAALSQRLALTVEALEQASQAKSDFLASMSHELRTPLSAIIGFSALMRDEPLTDGRRPIPDEWIEHVRRSGDHLLALINDVLDLTKIEAGRIDLSPEPFELGTALAESVEGLRPLADRKEIAMVLEAEPGVISADRGRLRQIVYNLLSNAIKFTPEGGRVTVEGRWDGSAARIVVTDTGVGIAPEDLAHVFEEFRQVGDLKAREAGTGLGLALTRRLAEAHGGSISLSSELGAGSRFEVLLPESRVAGTETVEAAGAVEGMAGSTVLVIEDDPGAVRLLRTYLEAEGYTVDVATDGEAGIAAARARAPGAIILDVLLPGIDGWEVLRRLKADPDLRDVPVMVATVVDERNIAMSLGAVDYFLKPVRPDALLARLATYTFTTKVKERNVRVLVIDDEPSARDLVASALRPEGFEVVTAASGDEGLVLAQEQPPDLVICDLLMPDMDGYEVVTRLAASDMPKDVPILILTGQELTAEDRERLNGKVADVMQKEADPRPALGRWLRRAAAASARRQGEPAAG